MDAEKHRESISVRARSIIEKATRCQIFISTAESCTGGLVGAALTSVPGASEVYRGGAITYVNEAKQAVLQVSSETLEQFTAVSEQTACEMAQGAAHLFTADIAVSVTGIAGPGGGSVQTPVGTVWIGLYVQGSADATRYCFRGDRDAVRTQAAAAALERISSVFNDRFK